MLKINEAFGEKYDVIFVNDEAGCGQVKKAMEEHALREDEKCRNSASAKKNGRAQTAAPAKEDKTRGNGFKTRRGGAKILGTVAGTLTPLSSIAADTGKVTVGGTIFNSDTRAIKNDKSLITLLITDKVTSLMLKFFVKNDYWSEIQGRIKVGACSSGPLVFSTPSVAPYSGCPGHFEPTWRKLFMSSSVTL